MTRWPRAVLVATLCLVLSGCTTGPGLGAPAGSGFHLAQIGGTRTTKDRALEVTEVSSPPIGTYGWTVASVVPADRALRLAYTDGACTSADRLAIQETATTVVIGITASKSFDGACVAVGIPRTTTVTLREPLGVRALMEASSGTDDGLSTVPDPSALPAPTCSSDDPSDVPVGMLDVTERMAPTAATTAFVCRTWWPKGIAHEQATSVTDRAAVARLVKRVNAGTTDVHAGGDDIVPCPTRRNGSWYDVYFQGPGLRVAVKVDEIGCRTITNGAISGRLTPALAAALDALFPA